VLEKITVFIKLPGLFQVSQKYICILESYAMSSSSPAPLLTAAIQVCLQSGRQFRVVKDSQWWVIIRKGGV